MKKLQLQRQISFPHHRFNELISNSSIKIHYSSLQIYITQELNIFFIFVFIFNKKNNILEWGIYLIILEKN